MSQETYIALTIKTSADRTRSGMSVELTVQALASGSNGDATKHACMHAKGVILAVSVRWGTFWTEKMVNVLRKKIAQKKTVADPIIKFTRLAKKFPMRIPACLVYVLCTVNYVLQQIALP